MFDFRFFIDVTAVCLLRNKMARAAKMRGFLYCRERTCMQSLFKKRDSSHIKQCVEATKRAFDQYWSTKELDSGILLKNTEEEVSEFLINFYAKVRKQNGELYSRSSIVNIGFGLQRFFWSPAKYDINDPEFKLSNKLCWQIRSGKGSVVHKEIINEEDISKLYCSHIQDTNTAQGLQYKVILDAMFYTCRRGRENLRKMNVTDFALKVDGQRWRFFLERCTV